MDWSAVMFLSDSHSDGTHSFWRHPFTSIAETFLQTWWRNKLILILDELRIWIFSVNYSYIRVKHVTMRPSKYDRILFWVNNILLKKHLNLDSSMISRISQWKSHVCLNAVYFIIEVKSVVIIEIQSGRRRAVVDTRSRKTGLADERKRSETRAHIT